jgi:hypothetical protein
MCVNLRTVPEDEPGVAAKRLKIIAQGFSHFEDHRHPGLRLVPEIAE